MLLGQQLRGRHQSRLQAAACGARGGGRGHHGLAAADIPLQQPHHRHAGGEILLRIGERARLGARQGERQRREEPAREPRAVRQRPGGVGLQRALSQSEREVVRQQLLERESPLRRVAAGGELGELRFPRRPVQVVQRLPERGQARRQGRRRGQPVAQRGSIQLAQRLTDERAQPSLGHALGERIDRRERVFQRRGFACEAAVFRVHHLEPECAAAYLAEAAQPRAARQALLLRGREMEEPQGQHPRAVGDPAQELAAAAVGDLGELDFPFHRRPHARAERPHGRHPRAVLVAQRQHEQQVGNACHAEARQARGERSAHPAQRAHRAQLGARARGGAGGGGKPAAQPRCRTHSISTCAPRGSCATPTTARAG